MKLGRASEAQPEFERAAALTENQQERELSLRRAYEAAAAAAAATGPAGPPGQPGR
jgi:predicted RNA polymerase sigma factor